MKHKILAYITRQRDGATQLLVFTHRDYPEAGVQVPAGTVEPGESIEAALFREVHEESGLRNPVLVRKLAEYEETTWGNIHHVFHLTAPEGTPESWTYIVHGKGEDNGMVFKYCWTGLDVGLAGNQAKWLSGIE